MEDRIVKICDIDNQVIAEEISECLTQEEIPFHITKKQISGYPGVLETDFTYAILEAPESYRNQIGELLGNIIKIPNTHDTILSQDKSGIKILVTISFIILLGLALYTLYSFISDYMMIKKYYNKDRANFINQMSNNQYTQTLKTNPNIKWVYIDENSNGNIEKVQVYGIAGQLLYEYYDDNENGIYERNIIYNTTGSPLIINQDKNEDLIVDEQMVMGDKEGSYTIYKDLDGDSLFDQKEIYINNKIIKNRDPSIK
ncbi:hypothetical protein [Spirochaeta cellobiosiphila]|uniref:hypothetical protein n=1 Tax=Spirochaeta cellobiosiphila TaxID=504483 RepID=UPI00048D8106|nr:hypothetical protein [Spirochaeta cellobiosiphila]